MGFEPTMFVVYLFYKKHNRDITSTYNVMLFVINISLKCLTCAGMRSGGCSEATAATRRLPRAKLSRKNDSDKQITIFTNLYVDE